MAIDVIVQVVQISFSVLQSDYKIWPEFMA